jgi:hypothetical protein
LLYPRWLASGFVSVAYFFASLNFLLKLVSASTKLAAHPVVSSSTRHIRRPRESGSKNRGA